MLGIGIDTGGTCTDAVIYDYDTGKVLDNAQGAGYRSKKLAEKAWKQHLAEMRRIC